MKKILFILLTISNLYSQEEVYDYEYIAMCDNNTTTFYRLTLMKPDYGWDSIITAKQFIPTLTGWSNYIPSGPVKLGDCQTGGGGGGGCCETSSNVGTNGYGVYEGQTGLNFEFRNIAPGSGKIIVTYDPIDKDIDIDVNIDSLVGISIDQIDSLRHYLGQAQNKLLWRYENINVGSAGQWDSINVDDDYLTLSGSGGKLNLSHKESIVSLNGLDTMHQNMVVTENGSNFTITSSGNTHEFNLPIADYTTTGKLAYYDWLTFYGKCDTSRTISTVSPLQGGGSLGANRTFSLANGTYTDINAANNWANLKVMGLGGRAYDTTGLVDGKILKYNFALGKWQLRDDSLGVAGYYQFIGDNGVGLPQRLTANYKPTATIYPIITDNGGAGRTDIEFNVQSLGITTNKIDSFSATFSRIRKVTQGLVGLGSAGPDTMRIIKVGEGLGFSGDSIYATGGGGACCNVTTITPPAIEADSNNYNPTGWDDARYIRITADYFVSITGMEQQDHGEKKTFINVGYKHMYFPGEHPNSSANNRIMARRDYILKYMESIEFTYDTFFDRWLITSTEFSDSNADAYYTWSYGSTTAGDWGYMGWSGTGVGQVIPTSNYPGAQQISTSTTSTGKGEIHITKNERTGYFNGSHCAWETVITLDTLSNSTDRYIATFGIISNNTSNVANVNNSVYIRYSDNINSGYWQGVSRNNSGTESTVNLVDTVEAQRMYRLRVEINCLKNEARFYINGVMRGIVNNNMPSDTGNGGRNCIEKTAGTIARRIFVHKMVTAVTQNNVN